MFSISSNTFRISIVTLACKTGFMFRRFLASEGKHKAGVKGKTRRLLPTSCVSCAPRSLRACLRSPEKCEKMTPVLQVPLTSVGLNSTLQPIDELGGGGLNLIVCQLVDWIF